MSAAKMVADSTQPDQDGKKRKKKVKKTVAKKVNLPEDEDSDLDLRRELKPIGEHLKSRSTMIEEMFRAVRGPSLQRALPDLLKSIPLEELKVHCLEQLEVMSKKRIRRILAGEESANISSSGTEDESTEEEEEESQDGTEAVTEARPADSTVTQGDIGPKPEEPPPPAATNFVASFEPVKIKEEPLDSPEEDNEETGEGEEEKEEEEEEEDEEENYTSGSEDGELVRREEVDQGSGTETVQVKQEPVSEAEEGKEEADESLEEGGGEMMDKMELLELEMRARAIKAMLSSQDDGDG